MFLFQKAAPAKKAEKKEESSDEDDSDDDDDEEEEEEKPKVRTHATYHAMVSFESSFIMMSSCMLLLNTLSDEEIHSEHVLFFSDYG